MIARRTQVTVSGVGLTWLAMVIGWLAGIALAKGVIQTVIACVFAPYGWYLTVERLMQAAGLLA